MHSKASISRKRPAQDLTTEHVVSSSGCASFTAGEFEITSMDVLLGRGKRSINNPGNKRFKKLVETYKGGYDRLEKVEKTRLSREIVNSVRRNGGRFLAMNPNTGVYEDAGDSSAREKVSHILREKPRKKKLKIKKNTKKSPIIQSNHESVGQSVLEKLLNKQKKIFDELSASHNANTNTTMKERTAEEGYEECLSSEFVLNLEGIADEILKEEDDSSLDLDDDSLEPIATVCSEQLSCS